MRRIEPRPNLGNSPPAAFGRRHVRCPHQVVPGRPLTAVCTTDSESEDAPGKDTNNPSCKRGVCIGSVKTGKVDCYIPPPPVSDAKFPPPEGIAVDSHGTIYTAAVQAKNRLPICDELTASRQPERTIQA